MIVIKNTDINMTKLEVSVMKIADTLFILYKKAGVIPKNYKKLNMPKIRFLHQMFKLIVQKAKI